MTDMPVIPLNTNKMLMFFLCAELPLIFRCGVVIGIILAYLVFAGNIIVIEF